MPTVPGAIGAFRREALADVGGVPAATLAEDTDLTMAVIRAGWRVVYVEDAIAWTEAPATLRQLWRQRYRWCYGTMQAMWKHRRALANGARPASWVGAGWLPVVPGPAAAGRPDGRRLCHLSACFSCRWAGGRGLGGLLAAPVFTAAYALRLDRERLGPLWTLRCSRSCTAS